MNGELAVNYFDHTAIIRVKTATPEISLLKKDTESEEFKTRYKAVKEKYEITTKEKTLNLQKKILLVQS